MASLGKIARRTFLIGSSAIVATTAGGATIGYYMYHKPDENPLPDVASKNEKVFTPYVRISADNTITVIVPRAEMGQGVSTTLAAMVAEELDVHIDQIRVEHGPHASAYYNEQVVAGIAPAAEISEGFIPETMRDLFGASGRILGVQVTGGSSSTRDAFERMRLAGAMAREVLKLAAAVKLGVDATTLESAGAVVTDPASGQSVTYGELAADAAGLELPDDVQLRPAIEWKLLGKPQPRTDILPKVTGAPIFGIDVDLPGMVYGTVKMCPRFGAKALSADFSEAEALADVKKIIELDTPSGSGFGVIAANTWAAFRAAEAIEVEWGEAPHQLEMADIEQEITNALTGSGYSLRDDGDVESELADTPRAQIVEAEYFAPYLAHACMEPMNATAQFKNGRLEIWAPTQIPSVAVFVTANALDISMSDVTLHVTSLGGGFGRRLESDFIVYAALMARETDGRPIKVTWSREEDIRHDTYRPIAAGRFRGRVGNDGLPIAVDMLIASPSIFKSMVGRILPIIPDAAFAALPERLLTEGAFDQPYTIQNYRVTGIDASLPVPVGFWRSVGHSFNGYFHECFLDEMAHAGGVDPVEMRKKLLRDHPVAVKVVEKAAEMSGWVKDIRPDRAKGFAFAYSFGSWVAQVVEIAEIDDEIRIEKMWIAADVGTALDPSIIEAQLISGAIFGLSSALMQEITFADGIVEQSNFHDFDAMRINQAPEFEVAILENAPDMGGVGEIGTPPAAPALANAVFALTGKRIRRLPLSREIRFV